MKNILHMIKSINLHMTLSPPPFNIRDNTYLSLKSIDFQYYSKYTMHSMKLLLNANYTARLQIIPLFLQETFLLA